MIKKIKHHIVNHRYSIYGLNRLEKIRIGSRKTSLIILIRIFLRKVNSDHITVRAKSITYDFFLSIFPGIIFLFTLIPYIPIENLDEQILTSLKDFFPGSMYESAESTIHDIISIPRKGLLSFGFIFAFYTANNGIIAIINTFNHCYKTTDDRSFIAKLGVSISILFLISLVVIASIVIGVITKYIYTGLENHELVFSNMQFYFFWFFQHAITYFLFLMSISIIYFIAPSVHERWSFFSVGSIMASILCFFFTNAFSFYIDHFNSYNKVYGSIGALIGIMLWMYINTLVLLVGFQINASLDIAGNGNIHKQ